MSDLASLVVDLIFKPGTSLLLVPVINISIVLLLVVLAFLLYTKLDPIHVVVMATLALGLLLSVNWYDHFIILLMKLYISIILIPILFIIKGIL